MYKISLILNDKKITQNYEILPYNRSNKTIGIEEIEKIKYDIYNVQKTKNVSFFLAVKEILKELVDKYDIYMTIDINGQEAVRIDLKSVKDIDTLFVFTIYACSGTENCYSSSNFGIMFDNVKIEIINGKINIVPVK